MKKPNYLIGQALILAGNNQEKRSSVRFTAAVAAQFSACRPGAPKPHDTGHARVRHCAGDGGEVLPSGSPARAGEKEALKRQLSHSVVTDFVVSGESAGANHGDWLSWSRIPSCPDETALIMKKASILLGGLLAASLCCLGAQAAAVPAKSKERATKPRAGKAVKAPRPGGRKLAPARAGVAIPPSIAPQGLPLALSASLGNPPPLSATVPSAASPASPPPPAAPVSALPAPVAPAQAALGPAPAPVGVKAPHQPVAYGAGPYRHNPYLPQPVAPPQAMAAPAQARPDVGGPVSFLPDAASLLGPFSSAIPILPGSGRSILPTIKKVYPTGEKPLVVISFKCPTELVGVTPPTIKILHDVVDLGMEGLNRSDLLSFNLQQVCQ